MLKNMYKLLLLLAACAGLYYYIHTNHINLKSVFSSCDCHAGGCSISGNPTLDGKPSSSQPVERVTNHIDSVPVQTGATPEPIVDTALTPEPKVETTLNPKPTMPAVAGKITPPKLDVMERPVSTPPAATK
jgi:hypothetical protein